MNELEFWEKFLLVRKFLFEFRPPNDKLSKVMSFKSFFVNTSNSQSLLNKMEPCGFTCMMRFHDGLSGRNWVGSHEQPLFARESAPDILSDML